MRRKSIIENNINLNRVWSASTDGYVEEAHAYVERAREQFELALEILRGLESRGGQAPS